MKNTIAERIYDFLKNFPPFNVLHEEELFTIATDVRVVYLEENSFIFKEDEEIHDYFYVVKDGAIGIFRNVDETLVDECDEGDIFGLRALLRKSNYQLSAKAMEESIVYGISSQLLERFITTNIDANKFLIASFVANTRNPYPEEDKGKLIHKTDNSRNGVSNLNYLQSAPYSKNPISCLPGTTIKEAAQTMSAKSVGSIVVTEKNRPIGIITDKDLRNKIATGLFAINGPVTQIMSSPVITYPKNISVADAQIAMLQKGVTHLCITKDGTPNSKLKGILSEHDIVVVHGNNPSFLFKEVKRAKTADKLYTVRQKVQQLLNGYLDQQIPISFITKIVSAINDALVQRAIDLSLEEMDTPPPIRFGWLMLGSQGRKEQLLLTDQDNALVFEDVSKADYDYTKDYFLRLARCITKKLNIIGFEYCPADMMASNPKWCMSLSEWKKQFNSWITQPDEDKIMLSTIFFDYHLVYGHHELVDQLSESIFKSIDSYEIFLNFLGLNALKNPPPLSFFRQFLVEQGGEHKDQFDIKARAIMPLVDAARLLILSHKIVGHNSTVLRFEELMRLEPQNKDLYTFCIDAFEILLRFRTQQGLKKNDSGRFIDLKTLSKIDRLKLKGCFTPIKGIQELIRVRFKLSQIM
ncbi:MAG: DUF294 nucleotidyltransferase-like domain-containing protein [Saonia sp.]